MLVYDDNDDDKDGGGQGNEAQGDFSQPSRSPSDGERWLSSKPGDLAATSSGTPTA